MVADIMRYLRMGTPFPMRNCLRKPQFVCSTRFHSSWDVGEGEMGGKERTGEEREDGTISSMPKRKALGGREGAGQRRRHKILETSIHEDIEITIGAWYKLRCKLLNAVSKCQ